MKLPWVAVERPYVEPAPEAPRVTLAEWNAKHEMFHKMVLEQSQHPERFSNGLTCPQCGGDLYDTNQVMSQSPIKIRVKCHGYSARGKPPEDMRPCNFKGERYG